MRSRDLDRLAATTYDVLVVGGGIHGLAIAYEAASRGLRTALVDAGDYGGAASFNHQKTAHGGLRSLQSGRIDRARQSIFERRALARIAPWLLRPLPFITGTYRSFIRNRLALRAAFKFDEWLGRHRNAGVEPELHLPAPRLISKAATLRLFPGIKQDGLTGAAQWYDYQMVEAERLTFAFAAAADRAGADLANYVEATAPLKAGGRIAGMQVRDRLSSNTFEIRAQVTVNAAGAHAGTVMAAFGVKRDFPLLKAMNLVTSKRASDIALASPSPSGRMLTLVPWRGRALIGTSQSSSLVQPDAVSVSAAEVEAFVREANAAFPALQITPADVTLVHRGAVPADGRTQRRGRSAAGAGHPRSLAGRRRRRPHRHRREVHHRARHRRARRVSDRQASRQASACVAHGDRHAAGRGDRGSRSAGDRNRPRPGVGGSPAGDPASHRQIRRGRGGYHPPDPRPS